MKFRILNHFDRHNELDQFIVTIIIAPFQTRGAKPKTGVQLRPLLQRTTATDHKTDKTFWACSVEGIIGKSCTDGQRGRTKSIWSSLVND